MRKLMTAVLTLAAAASLAAAGADLRLVDAVKNGDRPAVKTLLPAKIDVNARQADGTTAIAWAAHRNDADLVDLLLKAGADPSIANDYGVSPLSLACTNRNDAVVAMLLDAKANPNVPQWSGVTPLMTCAESGSVEAV